MYKINQVAKITGISEFDLRNWEKRSGFPTPARTSSGQRAYSDKEITALILVKKDHLLGLSPNILAERYKEYLSLPVVQSPNPFNVSGDSLRFVSSLIEYNMFQAEAILSEMRATWSLINLVNSVFLPVLTLIGDLWHEEKVNVAQEHFASNYIRSKMFSLLATQTLKKTKHRCLIGTLPGEQHEGATLALALNLQVKHITPYYLGAEIPLDSFLEAEKATSPQVVCLSFSDTEVYERYYKTLGSFRSTVIVGGTGVNDELPTPENVKKIGFSDMEQIAEYIYSTIINLRVNRAQKS